MNKKGFTLVEIIAVIVIMGILLLIVVPTTSNLMRSNEEKEYVTYYDIVQAGLEKYARTKREEVGGTSNTGCIDDKNLSDMIRLGYVKEFDQEDDVVCGTPSEFDPGLLSSWGVNTSKTYASMRVEGDHGKITTKLSLICVKMNEDGTYGEQPEYIKLVEGGECNPSEGSPDTPEPPPTPDPDPIYYTITYDKNSGTSCTKTTDSLTTGQAVDLTPTCTRSGYSFRGWSKTKNGTKLTSLTVEDQDITLYAKWESNSTGSTCLWGVLGDSAYTSFNIADLNYVEITKNGVNMGAIDNTWTNQPVIIRVRKAAISVDYSWVYNEKNVEFKTNSKKITGVGPNGNDFLTVDVCVRYDTKAPTVTITDSCSNYTSNTYKVTHNLVIKDGGSGTKVIKINGAEVTNLPEISDPNGNHDLAGTMSKQHITYFSSRNPYKPISVELCDYAGNCSTTTYSASSISSDGMSCK